MLPTSESLFHVKRTNLHNALFLLVDRPVHQIMHLQPCQTVRRLKEFFGSSGIKISCLNDGRIQSISQQAAIKKKGIVAGEGRDDSGK